LPPFSHVLPKNSCNTIRRYQALLSSNQDSITQENASLDPIRIVKKTAKFKNTNENWRKKSVLKT